MTGILFDLKLFTVSTRLMSWHLNLPSERVLRGDRIPLFLARFVSSTVVDGRSLFVPVRFVSSTVADGGSQQPI